MKFRILDSNGNNVMGLDQTVSEDNVYVKTYCAAAPGCKHPLKLAPGESTHVHYSLSGTKGKYMIVRDE